MASHFLTNRGKFLNATGAVHGATDLNIGLLNGTSVPAAADTQAEINDLNFVSELLALSGVVEVTATGYARQALASVAATEDDTNDRVNIDAANVTISGVQTGGTVIGGFIFKTGASDAARALVSVFWLDAPGVPTNGSDITLTIADLYRLT